MPSSSPFIAVSCNSYKNNILSGFTRLQEHQEFVDLTLAADGHLVKVHKNIIGLASPYLKKMIQSVSSPDPVIFLNNVNHNLLALLLEYIYQGEVSVPQDSLDSFLQVSEALHITGINKVMTKKNKNKETSCQPQNLTPALITSGETCEEPVRPNNYAACITINSDRNIEVKQFIENFGELPCPSNVEGPQYAENRSALNIQDIYYVNSDNAQHTAISTDTYQDNAEFLQTNDMELDQNLNQDLHNREALPIENEHVAIEHPTVPTIQILDASNTNSETPLLDLAQPLNLDKEAIDALKIITQYSTSERGAVQIIVSRYIYCRHHESNGGRKRRWRCSDYRKLHCPAYIDSFDDRIVLRKGIHCHGYHDDKIYLKHKQCLIFPSVQQAIEVKDHSIVNVHRRR